MAKKVPQKRYAGSTNRAGSTRPKTPAKKPPGPSKPSLELMLKAQETNRTMKKFKEKDLDGGIRVTPDFKSPGYPSGYGRSPKQGSGRNGMQQSDYWRSWNGKT